MLARARACENHVYLVSSTYEDISRNWMLTAVYDHAGEPVAKAQKWGTVIVAEVSPLCCATQLAAFSGLRLYTVSSTPPFFAR